MPFRCECTDCREARDTTPTPADLIALRDKWRTRAIKEREDSLQPVAFSGTRKAIGNGIAAVYDSCADQLDALITRLSSETEKEKP